MSPHSLIFSSTLCLKAYRSHFNPRGGLQAEVGLKSMLVRPIIGKGLYRLLAASSFSHFSVMTILIDLKEVWLFLWLAKSEIQRTRLDLSRAITSIDGILGEKKCSLVNKRYTIKS